MIVNCCVSKLVISYKCMLSVLKSSPTKIAGVSARSEIETSVLSWPGTSAHPHRFGGVEFRLGRRELGHLHGDVLLDVPFPSKVRDELIAAGRAQPHHVLPDSGWISFRIKTAPDVQAALELLRMSYEIAIKQKAK